MNLRSQVYNIYFLSTPLAGLLIWHDGSSKNLVRSILKLPELHTIVFRINYYAFLAECNVSDVLKLLLVVQNCIWLEDGFLERLPAAPKTPLYLRSLIMVFLVISSNQKYCQISSICFLLNLSSGERTRCFTHFCMKVQAVAILFYGLVVPYLMTLSSFIRVLVSC